MIKMILSVWVISLHGDGHQQGKGDRFVHLQRKR